MIRRREFLEIGGLALAALVAPRAAHAAAPVVIHMENDASRVHAWFDPVGVFIRPGQTVRWILDADVHATAAYHPKNAKHSLRIPEAATPWDSGLMTVKGGHFDVTFTVEGVYDYFCLPHENDGMVADRGRPAGGAGYPALRLLQGQARHGRLAAGARRGAEEPSERTADRRSEGRPLPRVNPEAL